jgi:hypothetical protein
MALAVMRGVAAPECLGLALDPDRDMNTPMAPELGLFLVSAWCLVSIPLMVLVSFS